MKKDESILVAIYCLVYNHESYLRDCFEGFVMQKTNFRFVAVVHDDCSTDNSVAIIREYAEKYPDIIKPIFEVENQYSKQDGSLDKILQESIYKINTKYVAFCEGDDYWTDPDKLQKQVDFLEANPQYGMVHTQASVYVQEKNSYGNEIKGRDVSSFEQLLCNCTIATLTVLIRRELLVQYYDEINPKQYRWLMGDYPLWLYCATKAKIHFIPEITATYRKLANSASHSSDLRKELRFWESSHNIQLYYAAKEHVPASLLHKINNEYEELIICRLIHISRDEALQRLKEAKELTIQQRLIIYLKIIRMAILKPLHLAQ